MVQRPRQGTSNALASCFSGYTTPVYWLGQGLLGFEHSKPVVAKLQRPRIVARRSVENGLRANPQTACRPFDGSSIFSSSAKYEYAGRASGIRTFGPSQK